MRMDFAGASRVWESLPVVEFIDETAAAQAASSGAAPSGLAAAPQQPFRAPGLLHNPWSCTELGGGLDNSVQGQDMQTYTHTLAHMHV